MPPSGAQTGAGGDEDPANCTVFVGGRVCQLASNFANRCAQSQKCSRVCTWYPSMWPVPSSVNETESCRH